MSRVSGADRAELHLCQGKVGVRDQEILAHDPVTGAWVNLGGLVRAFSISTSVNEIPRVAVDFVGTSDRIVWHDHEWPGPSVPEMRGEPPPPPPLPHSRDGKRDASRTKSGRKP